MESSKQQNFKVFWWVIGTIVFISIVAAFSDNNQTTIPINNSGVFPETTNLPMTQTECINIDDVKYSTDEKSRIMEILNSVFLGTIEPTYTIYSEFWSIINSHGAICDRNFDSEFTAPFECTKLFDQDALVSLSVGKPYKSSQRLDCETKNLSVSRIKENEVIMFGIATGLPIKVSTWLPEVSTGNAIIITKEMIQSDIDKMSTRILRIRKLLL